MLILKSLILLLISPAAIATMTVHVHSRSNASSIGHPAHADIGTLSTGTTTLHDLEAVFVFDGFVDMIGWARRKDSMFRVTTDLDDAAQSVQESIDIVSAADVGLQQSAPVLLEHLALYRLEVNNTLHLLPSVQDHILRTASYLSNTYGQVFRLKGIPQPIGRTLARYEAEIDRHARDLRAAVGESLASLDRAFNHYLSVNAIVLNGDHDDVLLAQHILRAKGALNNPLERGLAAWPITSYANTLVMRRVAECMVSTVGDVGAYLQKASRGLDAEELEGWVRGIIRILRRVNQASTFSVLTEEETCSYVGRDMLCVHGNMYRTGRTHCGDTVEGALPNRGRSKSFERMPRSGQRQPLPRRMAISTDADAD